MTVALRFCAWGGEMHLHPLSIALHGPIYIYSTFLTQDGINVYLQKADSDELQQHFRNRVRGTTQHFLYTPPGEEAEIQGRSILCGFFPTSITLLFLSTHQNRSALFQRVTSLVGETDIYLVQFLGCQVTCMRSKPVRISCSKEPIFWSVRS